MIVYYYKGMRIMDDELLEFDEFIDDYYDFNLLDLLEEIDEFEEEYNID